MRSLCCLPPGRAALPLVPLATAPPSVALRRMTAFAEFTSECAVFITLFEWPTKRRRRLIALDHGRSPVTHLCFSCDGRNLVVQTGAPDWTMHYVAWEKGTNGKVLAALRNVAPVTKSVAHVEGHPVDPALIATSGRGFVRLFRFQDDALKAVPINLRRDPGLFSCHAWLPDDRLVLGTVSGDLWFVEGTEFKRILDSGPPTPDKRACVIQAFSKGFIVGGERGSLRLFERSEDTKYYFKVGPGGAGGRVGWRGVDWQELPSVCCTSSASSLPPAAALQGVQRCGRRAVARRRHRPLPQRGGPLRFMLERPGVHV